MLIHLSAYFNSRKIKSLSTLLIISLYLFLYVFILSSKVSAYNIPTYYNVALPANYSTCGCADTPSECANSQNPNNCGLATCAGGNAWTKYQRKGCVVNDDDPFAVCGAYYDPTLEQVYSIGDKCVTGEQGLRPSSCTNIMGSGMYKTCCSFGTPSFANPGSCVDFAGDTTNPPWEGTCPAGYRREVFCGPGYGVPCGQAACGSVTPPPPIGPLCGDNICESLLGENSDNCREDCPAPAPNLTTFTGVSANGSTTCYQATYTASLSWSGTPLPSNDPSCPNGYWVDITQDSGFGTYSNQCVQNTTSLNNTTLGGPYAAGKTYYARVYNGAHSNTLSLTVPANACTVADTQAPTCNGVTVTPAHGPAGTVVNITASASDNVLVQNMQIFKNNGNSLLSSFSNTLKNNPFTNSFSWNTQEETQGSYTIIVNAVDAAGNLMRGLENTCNKPYTVDPPPPPPDTQAPTE